jgi:hypothetical protein
MCRPLSTRNKLYDSRRRRHDSSFFFAQVKTVHSSFPLIFQQKGDEDGEGQESEEGTEIDGEETGQDDTGWGLVPLMFGLSESGSTPLREIYDWPVLEFFYMASYLVDKQNKQLEAIKKIKKVF